MRICDFPDCGRRHDCNGYCPGHNKQLRKGQELRPIVNQRPKKNRKCDFPGCELRHKSHGYCQAHYKQLSEGKELKPLRTRTKYGSTCEIPDCGGEHSTLGYCSKHWDEHVEAGGDPSPLQLPATTRDCQGRKLCGDCRKWKPTKLFYVTNARMDGLSSICKACTDKKQTPIQRHNVSQSWFDEAAQLGCEVCGSTEKLHIDHDHTCCPGPFSCGECIRGLLCGIHNRGIGSFQDNPDYLIAAAFYLMKYSQVNAN